MKNFPLKKVLILVAILALPGFLYYLLQDKGKNRYATLAYFGPKVPADTFHSKMGKKIRDTIYHEVMMPTMVDQDGNNFELKDYKDQIFVINLFYTDAGHPATIASQAIKRMSNAYSTNQHIKFLSVSLDPTKDSPSVLKTYAKQNGVSDNRWRFIVGDKEDTFQFVKDGLLLDAVDGQPIAYTNMLVLMDYKHRIRGFYEVASKESVDRLQDEIIVLLTEELRNNNDGR